MGMCSNCVASTLTGHDGIRYRRRVVGSVLGWLNGPLLAQYGEQKKKSSRIRIVVYVERKWSGVFSPLALSVRVAFLWVIHSYESTNRCVALSIVGSRLYN